MLDLDGVVWLAETPIPGAADAVARLIEAGHRVLYLTNNSSATVETYVDKLTRHGLPATEDDLVTSAQAAATLVAPGERVLVCAGPGVEQALHRRGAVPVRQPGDGVDAVMVGWHRDFDFDRLTVATRAVLAGARLIGTNDDATYPTDQGLLPGGGALLAAVAYASGATPQVAGKPHAPVADLVRERLGGVPDVVVGDRPDTDGRLARLLGSRFALVLTGVTGEGDVPLDPVPDVVAPSLAALVDRQYPRGEGA